MARVSTETKNVGQKKKTTTKSKKQLSPIENKYKPIQSRSSYEGRYNTTGKTNNPKAYGGTKLTSIKDAPTGLKKIARNRKVTQAKKKLGW